MKPVDVTTEWLTAYSPVRGAKTVISSVSPAGLPGNKNGVNMTWNILHYPVHPRGGSGGFKWLVHNYSDQKVVAYIPNEI